MQATKVDIVCDTAIVTKNLITRTVPGVNCETINVNVVGVADPDVPITYINNVSMGPITVVLLNPKHDSLKYFSILPNSLGLPVTIKASNMTFQLVNNTQLLFSSKIGGWITITNNVATYPDDQVNGKFTDLTSLNSQQGTSIATSNDGNTIALGGILDGAGNGAAWIYVKNASTQAWSLQAKLIGTASVGANKGRSVALSGNGNTLAVGGPGDTANTGAIWVFIRNPTTNLWSQQVKIIGNLTVPGTQLGWSVSLSLDGNTLASGGPGDTGFVGATWIFIRNPITNIWSQQVPKFTGSGFVGLPEQGWSISLSADGNTLAVGGPNDGGNGAVWIFTRSGGLWTQLGNKLTDPAGVGSLQGWSVSLSSNASTLAYGGYLDTGGIGATWVWGVLGGSYVQQAKLVGSGTVGPGGNQGTSVSLSSDGNTLAVGGPGDAGGIGATWIFTRVLPISTIPLIPFVYLQQTKLIGVPYMGLPSEGTSVSLSGSGNTVAIGGIGDNALSGAMWIFS